MQHRMLLPAIDLLAEQFRNRNWTYYDAPLRGHGQQTGCLTACTYEIPNISEYKKVDYAIGVNGNSMEPVYHDGDMLLVEMTDKVVPGDVGIFLVDNESYVKKNGDGKLISLNPAYDNIPLTEDSKCMGKVIGTL